VYSSIDGGASWEEINGGLTNGNVNCLAFDPDGYLYAGPRGGTVFRSSKPVE
jgi:photosystem II stability/assembly factor-like uncharacterized protein